VADGGSLSRLPSSNRGVSRSGSSDARREALARGRERRGPAEAELRKAAESESRTWAGIDWLAGSVDLWDLLDACGWRAKVKSISGEVGDVMSLDGLATYLRAFGPKPKDETEAGDDGELITGRRVQFVPADAVIVSIVQAAFQYLFAGSGLTLGVDAGPGSFYAYKFALTNVWGDFAGSIEVGGQLTQRKGGRPSLRFELTGLGCGLYEQRGDVSADHAERWCALRAKLEHVGPMLTRVDTAFDDFDGTRNLALVRCMYEVGEFDYSFGGERKRPKRKEFLSSGDGDTFYVGQSSSEKQLRVYEKGKQLGDPDSPWVRWEMQMRSSTRKRISLDVLSTPLDYMRGAYECLDFVASCVARLVVTEEATKATFKSVVRHAKRMYGATFDQVMRIAPSPEQFNEFMQLMRTDKVPRWAKTGRLNWADVPGLIPCPDIQEEISYGAE